MESLQRSYPALVQLHLLADIDAAARGVTAPICSSLLRLPCCNVHIAFLQLG
jgi:hypothetical protein